MKYNYYTVAVTVAGGRPLTRTVQYPQTVSEDVIMHRLKAKARETHGKYLIQVTVTKINYRNVTV